MWPLGLLGARRSVPSGTLSRLLALHFANPRDTTFLRGQIMSRQGRSSSYHPRAEQLMTIFRSYQVIPGAIAGQTELSTHECGRAATGFGCAFPHWLRVPEWTRAPSSLYGLYLDWWLCLLTVASSISHTSQPAFAAYSHGPVDKSDHAADHGACTRLRIQCHVSSSWSRHQYEAELAIVIFVQARYDGHPTVPLPSITMLLLEARHLVPFVLAFSYGLSTVGLPTQLISNSFVLVVRSPDGSAGLPCTDE